MKHWLHSLTIVMTLCVAGCGVIPRMASNARGCDDITAIELRALLKEAIPPIDMRNRLAVLYQVPTEKVEFSLHEDHTAFLNVTKNGLAHTVLMTGTQLYQATVTFKTDSPPVETAVRCLGEPTWYWAYYFSAQPRPITRSKSVCSFRRKVR